MKIMQGLYYHKIFKEIGLIVEFVTGKLIYEESLEFKRNLSQDKDFNSAYNFITILYSCELLYTEEEINKYKIFLDQNKNIIGKRRSALLTNSPEHVVFSHIYKEALSNFPMNFQIFTTINAALSWLQLPISYENIINNLINDWKKTQPNNVYTK